MTTPSLASRFAGRPLALAPRALEPLLAATPIEARSDLALVPRGAGFSMTDSGIAVVPVIGPMVSRGDWLTELFGIGDYASVGSTITDAFADPATRAVVMEIDSPGGEVGGLFDLTDRIRSLKLETGKPLWAVASEAALSAAYAIASTADRLYVTRTGEAGSIGVVAIHVDESAADTMAGRKYTLIHAGAKKVDGNAHEPLAPEAHADIQADVDALHEAFVALVARNRDLAPEVVRATQAAIYRGQRAVEAGLADRIGTMDQALAELANQLASPASPSGRSRSSQPHRRNPAMSHEPKVRVSETETEIETETETVEEAVALSPVVETPSSPEPDPATALRAEYAEIAAIAAQGVRLGVTVDAADAMKKGIKPDALRRSILNSLATRAEASAIVSAAPQTPVAGDSPIVRRARERAASKS